MNKNFWLFTIVCALFVSAVTTVLSLSGALSITNLSIPCVVPRNTSHGTKT